MKWNNGLERKKFEEKMAKQASEYRRLGMSEDQIQAMYEYDKAEFNRERREAVHNQPLLGSIEDMEEEGQNPLLLRYPDRLSVELEQDEGDPFWWIDTLENEALIKAVRRLSYQEKMLLTLVIIEGWSIEDAAACPEVAIPRSTAYFRMEKLMKKIRALMRVGE